MCIRDSVQNAHAAVVSAEIDRLVLGILHGNREAVGVQRDGVCTGRLNVLSLIHI